MPKLDDTGVYRKKNGCWEYRFGVVVGGKTVFKKKSTDEHGNKLMTKSAAVAARDAAMVAVRQERTEKPKIARRKVKEVFEEFCAEGRKDRAYGTIRKQDSIWENHLRERFGNRYVDEISSADVVDYLSELYYVDGLAFMYVESFLKMTFCGTSTSPQTEQCEPSVRPVSVQVAGTALSVTTLCPFAGMVSCRVRISPQTEQW